MRSERNVDRRRAPRRQTASGEPLSCVRLRAGRDLTVIDVSDLGMLAFGAMRLLPGTHVDVHLVTRHGRVLVRSRVVRASVCHVSADEIRYVGALVFDRSIDTEPVGYGLPSRPAPAVAE